MFVVLENVQGDIHDIWIKHLSTAGDVRKELGGLISVEPDRITIIYQGKVLSPERTLESYDITEGTKLYYSVKQKEVKTEAKVKPKEDPQESTSLFGNIANNPLMQGMIKSMEENPELAAEFLKNFPGLKNGADKNPEFSHALNDPEQFAELLRMTTTKGNQKQAAITMDNMLNMVDQYPSLLHTANRIMNDFSPEEMEDIFGPSPPPTVIPETKLLTPSEGPLPNSQPSLYLGFTANTQGNERKETEDITNGMYKIQSGVRTAQTRGIQFANVERAIALCELEKRRIIARSVPQSFKTQYAKELQYLLNKGFVNQDDNLCAMYLNNGDVHRSIQYLMRLEAIP